MPSCLAALPCFLLQSFCLLFLSPLAAASDADTGTDPSMVIERYTQHFVVDPDGAYTLTVDNVKLIVEQRALQAHGQYYIGYNAALDEVRSVEAYTLKGDGRRVPVPPEQIKDQQESASTDAPMFQDTRLKAVVFADVAVGDRVVVRYVVRRHTPLFAGQFEDLSASQFYQNRDFRLIYDMPASMPLFADAAGFVELPIDSPAGRKRYQWRYVPGPNRRIEADSVSYLDYGKRLAVSTFAGYAAFARAYQAGAHDKAQPAAAITALAQELTAGLDTPRARALALSEWVRRHIRYVAVYVGAGGVVPHAASTVLANRYGDCKDHAILLEALLAAAGIDSSAVLVNSGNAYRLPSAPTLGIFNHVMTYVPALDLYLDSTAESIAAGFLPPSAMGKPVLITKAGRLANTPVSQAETNRTATRFEIDKQGRSRFRVHKRTTGAIAEPYRHAVRETREAERSLFVQRMLLGLGQRGAGSFDPGDVDGRGDDYAMGIDGVSENFAQLPGPAGLATTFNFWGGLGDAVFNFGQEKERTQDFVCPAIDAADDTGFTFAKGVRIVALPASLALRDANFSYQARYERRGNTVTVRRQLRFRNARAVCTPQDYRRMRPLVERMMRDLKSQIIVR